ncbi:MULTISPECIES: TetR/AcrR family transcriptional regulator [unclassified Streptomyces]|uniref:TetR/AcrR family transcriptional regulator n=1 Tax=unclassified Streptomyces TaxID=2593676 RepID=UPI00332746AB
MKRAEARQRNTTALLDAALTEMAAHGYAAARLEDIAARAGLTTGAVYSLFGSKHRLLAAAVEHLAHRLRSGLEELAARQDLSLREVLRGLATVMHRAAAEEPAAQWYAFEVEAASLALRDPELAGTLARHTGEITDLVRGILTDRVIDPAAPTPARTTPEQAAHLAPAVRALTAGLAQQAIHAPGTLTGRYAADAAAALAHLLDQGPAGRASP